MRSSRRLLSSSHSSSKEYFDKGEQLLSRGKFRAASLNFQRSLQHSKDESVQQVVKNRLAFSLAQNGDLGEAEKLYREIHAAVDAKEDPLLAAKANVAAIQSQRGRFGEALQSLQEVLERRVEAAGAYALETLDCQIDVAHLKHVMGDVADAEAMLTVALRVLVDNNYFEELGDSCISRLLDVWNDKRFQPDVQVVTHQFELCKEITSSANLQQFASIFLRLEQNEMVIDALTAAILRDPRDRELSQNLAILLIAEGRHADAAQTLQTGLEKNPSPQYLLRTLHLLSDCYIEMKKWKEAEDTLKKIYNSIRKNKANSALQEVSINALKKLADVSTKLQKPNQAKYYLDAARKEAGDDDKLTKLLESKT